MYETVIPTEVIEEEELRNLASSLSKATGAEVIITKQYVAATDNVHVSSMFDDLVASIGDQTVKIRKPKLGKVKAVKSKAPAGKRSVELGDGRIMSMQAFNKALQEGRYEPGMLVTSSVHGKGNVSQDGKTVLWGLPS